MCIQTFGGAFCGGQPTNISVDIFYKIQWNKKKKQIRKCRQTEVSYIECKKTTRKLMYHLVSTLRKR